MRLARTPLRHTRAMPHVYYLVGPPAVGKLTVARELERRTGAIVVDNHLINDPVFVPMGLHRGEGVDIDATDRLRDRVREVVHVATELAPASFSHVFTNWLPDKPEAEALVQRLRLLAQRRGVGFVPVWLRADPDQLAARVVQADRSQRAKLMDADVLRTVLSRRQLPAPVDAIVLDTTRLQPHEVVDRILEAG